MAENKKEKRHVQWVNCETIITDSDTTEDETEVPKSTTPPDEERYA